MKLIKYIICTLLLLYLPLSAAQPKFVGNKGCKACHKDQVADWKKSSHARAFSLLEAGKKKSAKKKAGLDPDKDYTKDKDCIGCHSVGYKKKGGFVDMATTPDKAGVGCESCHGSGGDYRKLHKKKKLTFTRQEAKKLGQRYEDTSPDICGNCHEHEDNPFQEKIDSKYAFDINKRKKVYKSFHKSYPMKVEH